MKKKRAEPTTSRNLEAKFDRGEEVLDYFEPARSEVLRPRKSGPKSYVVEQSATKGAVVREHPGTYASKGTLPTQHKNPKSGDDAKRKETPGSKKKGEFMDNKKGGEPFKGVAKEPDKRRK